MPIIKSKNFILREYRKGDEKSLIENINDRYIYDMTSRIPHPYKLKDARKFINKCIKLRRQKKKTAVYFAIDINGEVIGGIGIDSIEIYKGEIGYWIGRKYRNKGIATKAVKLMTDFGFKKLRLKRIYAHVLPKNKASDRVLEKNSYEFEGLLRKHHIKNGKLIDAELYAKIK